ncbi:ribose-phosphate pyrophosphokinase [Candidatus Woesearchaeota archaeon]|nr:ribose-phosphate pyrophosphokinase [Candidatus Woesearchaeota archaeon]
MKEIGILSCKSGKPFAEKIVLNLEEIVKKEHTYNIRIRKIESKEIQFANTEIKTRINESIRGLPIFIIQDVSNLTNNYSVNDNVIALITAIEATKTAQSGKITVVIPSFPYVRQDKAIGREGITSSWYATAIEKAGAEHILTLDIHNEAIAGFFKKAVLDNLKAKKNISEYLEKEINTENLIVVSPDLGGVKRADNYAKILNLHLAIIHKERNYSKNPREGNVEKMTLIGDVKDKEVIMIDDIIDTGKTIIKAAELLKKNHVKNIYIGASLGLFSPPAADIFKKAYDEKTINKVYVTNAVYHGEKFRKENKWYNEIDISDYFAKVIFNLSQGKSISQLLKNK